MPRVLELREIDGALWARVDVEFGPEAGSVSLYTPEELAPISRALQPFLDALATIDNDETYYVPDDIPLGDAIDDVHQPTVGHLRAVAKLAAL
jgi:hypothetical protein